MRAELWGLSAVAVHGWNTTRARPGKIGCAAMFSPSWCWQIKTSTNSMPRTRPSIRSTGTYSMLSWMNRSINHIVTFYPAATAWTSSRRRGCSRSSVLRVQTWIKRFSVYTAKVVASIFFSSSAWLVCCGCYRVVLLTCTCVSSGVEFSVHRAEHVAAICFLSLLRSQHDDHDGRTARSYDADHVREILPWKRHTIGYHWKNSEQHEIWVLEMHGEGVWSIMPRASLLCVPPTDASAGIAK